MEDDYERPAYLDMSPMDLAALGDGMAYTDMGDDPATIKALDDAEDFDDLLSRSSVGGVPITAEYVAANYRMTVAEAQQMIDAGAVVSGQILFVNAEARDEFNAWLESDRNATGHDDEDIPDADTVAAVQKGIAESERGETKYLGRFAQYADNRLPEGVQYTDAELGELLECIPPFNPFSREDTRTRAMTAEDEEILSGPSYADQVNAPLTEAEIMEIRRQIKSGDYPRFIRTTLHKTDRDGITTDVHVAQPVRNADDVFWPDDDAVDQAEAAAALDAAITDGTAGTTVAHPGLIACNPDNHMPWDDDYQPDHAADPMFYIWSNKHQLYWGPDRKGYVEWPSQAGQYTAVEASAIINHSMRGIILGQNRAVPDSIMLPVPDTIPDGAQ